MAISSRHCSRCSSDCRKCRRPIPQLKASTPDCAARLLSKGEGQSLLKQFAATALLVGSSDDLIHIHVGRRICAGFLATVNGFIPQTRDMVLGHEFMGVVEMKLVMKNNTNNQPILTTLVVLSVSGGMGTDAGWRRFYCPQADTNTFSSSMGSSSLTRRHSRCRTVPAACIPSSWCRPRVCACARISSNSRRERRADHAGSERTIPPDGQEAFGRRNQHDEFHR